MNPVIVRVPPMDFAAMTETIDRDACPLPEDYVTHTRGAFNPPGSDGPIHDMLELVQAHAGEPLLVANAFGRRCETGAVLLPHVDRPGLDYTVSIPLDDRSAQWPIHVDDVGAITVPFGWGVVMGGRHVKHWRAACPAGPSTWLLLHYRRESRPFEPIVSRDLISPEDVARIRAGVEGLELETGTTGGDNSTRVAKVGWLYRNEPKWDWLYRIIDPWMIQAPFGKWHFDDPQPESIQFTHYPPDGRYGWHPDRGNGNRRIVSCTILLNAAERGGTLEFRKPSSAPQLTAGDGVVFQAHHVHRVTPVEEGIRESLVAWLSGEAVSSR